MSCTCVDMTDEMLAVNQCFYKFIPTIQMRSYTAMLLVASFTDSATYSNPRRTSSAFGREPGDASQHIFTHDSYSSALLCASCTDLLLPDIPTLVLHDGKAGRRLSTHTARTCCSRLPLQPYKRTGTRHTNTVNSELDTRDCLTCASKHRHRNKQ